VADADVSSQSNDLAGGSLDSGYAYSICMRITISTDAPLFERVITIEIGNGDGFTNQLRVIGKSTFVILEALTEPIE